MFGFDVKICGLSTPETIAAALERGASHIGFVHFGRSPRHLAVEAMAPLRVLVGNRAQSVIVTVDPEDGLVDRFVDEVKPDWLQLHGKETPERVAAIRARVAPEGIRVMKALPVSVREDLAAISAYADVSDRILLDSKRPASSELPGGNGVAFDWTLLAEPIPGLDRYPPIMLSGGLDAQNVGFALRIAKPSGIDVSSGVERAPGVKDVARIHQFFDALDRFAEPVGKAEAS